MAKKVKIETIGSAEKPTKKKSEKKGKKKKDKKLRLNTSHADEIGRLNRVTGQMNGIAKMLESGRDLNDVLTQFKAVHSALRSIELRVFDTYINQSITDITATEKRKEREAKIIELKNLLAKG